MKVKINTVKISLSWKAENPVSIKAISALFNEDGSVFYWKVRVEDICFLCFSKKLAERGQKAFEENKEVSLSGNIKIVAGGTYLVIKKLKTLNQEGMP